MRAKIKNIIYIFLAAVVVCLASIITEAHAASTEVTSEISSCRFADRPIRCALSESKLEVEPLNFTTVGQTFDATIKFTNNTDKEMSVVDESDVFTHANLKREIFTEEDFNGKLKPGASTNITIRLSYIAATVETLQLDNLGFNITFTPAEENFTLTEATTDAQPEDLPQNSTNPNTADTVIPFAIFSGSSLILAFILRKKAVGKVFAVAFIASAAAIPHTATASDKIAFNITFAGINNQPLAIYINQPEEKTEEPEPEIDAEAPTSDEETETAEEPTHKAPEEQEEKATTEQEAETESTEEQPVESAQPEENSAEPTQDEEQPTAEPEKLPIYIEPTKETQEQSAEEPEDNPKTSPEPEQSSEPDAEEPSITTETPEETIEQEPKEQPVQDQQESTESPDEQPKEEQQTPIENPITETEPAKTEIKTEEPVQEQALVKGGYKYANICPGATGYDDWGLVKCQCVSYGANRVYNNYGKFPNWRGHANAYEWISNAQNEGFIVTNTPKPGAIGVLPRGQYSSYGHIVYVEKVEGDRVYISQYNEWPAKGDYSEKWANASTYQYIYFYEYSK